MLVTPHTVTRAVVVPSTPIIRELLGDPDTWKTRVPCKCDDCVRRGRAIVTMFVGPDTYLMYGSPDDAKL